MISTRRVQRYTVGLVLVALLLVPSIAYAVKQVLLIGEQVLWVPGVYIAENGSFVGLPSRLDVKAIYPGEGNVYFSTQPLTMVDTQAAARIAALIASLYAGADPLSVDWLVSLESNTTTIGGPSASAATALAMYAVLTGRRVPRNISLTGMIDIDGSIGPVGGVVEKLRAMARMGVKLFFIPAGEEISYEIKRVVEHKPGITIERETRIPVNVTELGAKLGVRVVPVASFAQLIEYVFGVKMPRLKPRLPKALQLHLKKVTMEYLREAEDNLTAAESLYKKYSGKLDRELASVVNQLLSSAKKSIESAKKAIRKKQYYVAASSAFQAAIEAGQAHALLEVIDNVSRGESVKKAVSLVAGRYLEAARSMLDRVKSKIDSLIRRHDVNALQIAIAVYTRLLEARDLINEATRRMSIGDWFHSTLNAVYAYYRSRTVIDWLAAYKLVGKGPSYDVNRLIKTVKMFVSYADMLDTYLTDIGIFNNFVTTARSYLDKANELLAAGAPPEEVLAPTITAIVYYVLALHAQYGTATVLYNASREMAIYAYTVVARKGATPILAASYIEAGDAANDALTKIDFYSRAAMILLVLYTLLYKGYPPPVISHHPLNKASTIKTVTQGEVNESREMRVATTTTSTANSQNVSSTTVQNTTPLTNTRTTPHIRGEVGATSTTTEGVVVSAIIVACIIAGIVMIAAYGLGRL